MVLNSLKFAVFFLIFLAVLLTVPKKLRKPWLLAGNCLFYLSWEKWSGILLLLSVLVVWGCGRLLKSRETDDGIRNSHRKEIIFLLLPLVWNVGLLVFFRYAGLIGPLFGRIGMPFSAADILAPLGISFYTLRCISYVAEIFRGRLEPQSLTDVFLYVSFFPQIISGPIEKPGSFFAELEKFRQTDLRDSGRILRSFLLFVWGLFQKIVLAERLSMITNHIFPNFQNHGFWELFAASLAYTLQIYCDFGGYSDMSRGIAGMMGFSAMRNFRQPYLACGIKSFWRRWHISLTDWLTEYVYIPLGGNRKGLLRKYVNILIVFAVSGLWHGRTLNFLFWGLLHGVFQIAEDLWTRLTKSKSIDDRFGSRLLSRFITLLAVNFAWIFFNAGGLNRGFRIVRQMFSRLTLPAAWDLGLIPGNLVVLGAGLLILLVVDVLHERGISIHQKTAALPLPLRWLLYLGLFWSVIMLGIYGVGYDTTGFIYAQF